MTLWTSGNRGNVPDGLRGAARGAGGGLGRRPCRLRRCPQPLRATARHRRPGHHPGDVRAAVDRSQLGVTGSAGHRYRVRQFRQRGSERRRPDHRGGQRQPLRQCAPGLSSPPGLRRPVEWPGRFVVSKYAHPGTYSIEYLTATDAAGNEQEYTGFGKVPEGPNALSLHPADNPTFTVTGTPANRPPRKPAGNLSAFSFSPSSVNTTASKRHVHVTARFTGASPSRVFVQFLTAPKKIKAYPVRRTSEPSCTSTTAPGRARCGFRGGSASRFCSHACSPTSARATGRVRAATTLQQLHRLHSPEQAHGRQRHRQRRNHA